MSSLRKFATILTESCVSNKIIRKLYSLCQIGNTPDVRRDTEGIHECIEKELADMAQKKMNWEELSPDDKMKYEIAEELGLLEQVKEDGWKSLSAKDTGRIGGLMTKRKREQRTE